MHISHFFQVTPVKRQKSETNFLLGRTSASKDIEVKNFHFRLIPLGKYNRLTDSAKAERNCTHWSPNVEGKTLTPNVTRIALVHL